MNFDVALFDLDGTLVDSREGILLSIAAALERLDRTANDHELAPLIGPPLQEIFSGLGLADVEIQPAIDAYREVYAAGAIARNRPYQGIDEVLARLVDAGVVIGVCTSKPWLYAEQIVAQHGWSDRFAVVSGPEMDGTRRHKPEILGHALAELGEPPRERVVMIGDRHYDITGAAAVGVESIGVTWGFGSRAELSSAGAGRILDDPHALVDAVHGRPG